MIVRDTILTSLIASFFIVSSAHAAQIAVPFTPQAPDADWREPWFNACEEAAIAMVDAYYYGHSLEGDKAREHILHVLNIKNAFFGHSLDESAARITELINGFFRWEATIVRGPTVGQLIAEIDAGRPVIVPTHGRALFNPHFLDGGPDYHTVVITGYDVDKQMFIVNEPGTKHGLDYQYSFDRLMRAVHDFLPGKKTRNGERVAIFTRPSIDATESSDADGDGLIKAREIAYGTQLWNADTDGDSYADGYEVEAEYSPILDESALPFGTLIKTQNRPEVYVSSGKERQHIISEEVFLSRGWHWHDIVTVSPSYMQSLQIAQPITN
jgi:hypothetical protein